MSELGTSLDISKDVDPEPQIMNVRPVDIKKQPAHSKKRKKKAPKKKHEPKGGDKDEDVKIVLLLLFIPLLLLLSIHIYESQVPGADALAEKVVTNSLISSVSAKVNADYALRGFPPESAVPVIKRQVKELSDTPATKDKISSFAETYKDIYRDDEGVPYLKGADAYLYVQEARNVIEYGHAGTILRDDEPINTLRSSPEGREVIFRLLTYVEVYMYKLVNQFSTTSLEAIAYYLPLLITLFSTVLIFFITRAFSNTGGGFFAAMIFAFHPTILNATTMGYTETTSLNILFSLLIVFLGVHLVRAMVKKDDMKKMALLGAGFVLAVVFFWLNWKGYYYIVCILLISVVIYWVNKIICDRGSEGDPLNWMPLLGGAALICAGGIYFVTTEAFRTLLSRLNLLPTTRFFPSTMKSIAELQRVAPSDMISQVGTMLFIISLVAGGVFLYRGASRYFSGKIGFEEVIVPVWFFSLLIAALLAFKFMAYFMLPLCIIAGIALSSILTYSKKGLGNIGVHIPRIPRTVVISLLMLLLIVFSIRAGLADVVAYPGKRQMNDATYDVAEAIKSAASEDSMIHLWWDHGYFYEYFAQVPVLFDGGTLERSRTYWYSKALTSTNDDLSRNILRMLACTGDVAFNTLSVSKGPLGAMDVLQRALVLNATAAKVSLADDGVDPGLIDEIFCDKENDFIVINDEDAYVFSIMDHFARWDFRLADIAKELDSLSEYESTSLIQERYNVTDIEAYDLYERYQLMMDTFYEEKKIFPFTAKCAMRGNDTVVCGNEFIINRTAGNVRTSGGYLGYIIATDDLYERSDSGPADVLIVYGSEGNLYHLVVRKDIVDTLFVKLLYLRGSEHFKPLYEARNPVVKRVLAYSVEYE